MSNLPMETVLDPDGTIPPLPEHVKEALAKEWADPATALQLKDANDLLKPGYLPLETGYARLPNGQIHVACLTKMPGCKGRMVKWFFGWQSNTNHYQWWHPHAHVWADWEKGPQNRNNDPDVDNFIGDSHLVHEVIGGETSKLRIHFLDPSEYLDTSRFTEANVSAAICARVGYLDKPLKISRMIHFIRDTEDGCEMRSRFWSGDIEISIPILGPILGLVMNTRTMRQRVLPEFLGEELLTHCAEEMNHLAEILPDLFYKMTGEKKEA